MMTETCLLPRLMTYYKTYDTSFHASQHKTRQHGRDFTLLLAEGRERGLRGDRADRGEGREGRGERGGEGEGRGRERGRGRGRGGRGERRDGNAGGGWVGGWVGSPGRPL